MHLSAGVTGVLRVEMFFSSLDSSTKLIFKNQFAIILPEFKHLEETVVVLNVVLTLN